MSRRTSIIFFLFLNIFVSICATLAVLVVWDRTQSPARPVLPKITFGQPAPTNTSVPSPEALQPFSTPIPTPTYLVHEVKPGETFESIAAAYGVSVDQIITANGYNQVQALSPGEGLLIPVPQVKVETVAGIGDLELEKVVISSLAEGELSLSGWRLEDQAGNFYTFPLYSIFGKGGQVLVFTKSGTDTAQELYWNLSEPVWASGKVAVLKDTTGQVRATYQVP
jgi:hypothetical protein